MTWGLIVSLLCLFAIGLAVYGIILYGNGIYIFGLVMSIIGFVAGIFMHKQDRKETND